jgi:hypothetical protein
LHTTSRERVAQVTFPLSQKDFNRGPATAYDLSTFSAKVSLCLLGKPQVDGTPARDYASALSIIASARSLVVANQLPVSTEETTLLGGAPAAPAMSVD